MRPLFVATSSTPPDAAEQVAAGQRHRIDYLELTQRLGGAYLDYNAAYQSIGLRRGLEQRARLDIDLARRARSLARNGAHDAVVSLSEKVAIPLACLLPEGIRHVVNGHHLLSPRKLRLLKSLRIPQRWDTIIVYGEAEARRLRQELPESAGRIRWLSDKVDTRFWKPPRPFSLPGEYVFSVGVSYRDYSTLVSALGMATQVPALIHPGSGWVAMDTSLNPDTLSENIELLLDFPNPVGLRELYERCRFAVVPLRPSTLWNIGATSALEAQAMGKPVIATRTPNMEHYVRHGETGILVDPNDSTAMAEAISSLWHDPLKAASMGRMAREWVESQFSFDRWLDEVTEVLNGSTHISQTNTPLFVSGTRP
jgi:glycosyltransferase involved in cell wall biosynthesis